MTKEELEMYLMPIQAYKRGLENINYKEVTISPGHYLNKIVSKEYQGRGYNVSSELEESVREYLGISEDRELKVRIPRYTSELVRVYCELDTRLAEFIWELKSKRIPFGMVLANNFGRDGRSAIIICGFVRE